MPRATSAPAPGREGHHLVPQQVDRPRRCIADRAEDPRASSLIRRRDGCNARRRRGRRAPASGRAAAGDVRPAWQWLSREVRRAATCSARECSTARRWHGSCCSNARSLSAADAIERLVGMQAQVPIDPYVGFWTRFEGFQPEELAGLITRGGRSGLADAGHDPPGDGARHAQAASVDGPVIERMFWTGSPFGRALDGVDIEALVAGPRAHRGTATHARRAPPLLAERWPDHDNDALSAIAYLLPVIQVPPRGVWGQSGQATWTTAESWLGRPLDRDPRSRTWSFATSARYGPAAVMDVQAWCGLTKLRAVVDRLRPRAARLP